MCEFPGDSTVQQCTTRLSHNEPNLAYIFINVATTVSNVNPILKSAPQIRFLFKDLRSERPVHRDRRRFAPPPTVSGAQAARQGLLRYRTSRGSQFCTSVASHLPHLLASHLFFSFFLFFFFSFFVVFFGP